MIIESRQLTIGDLRYGEYGEGNGEEKQREEGIGTQSETGDRHCLSVGISKDGSHLVFARAKDDKNLDIGEKDVVETYILGREEPRNNEVRGECYRLSNNIARHQGEPFTDNRLTFISQWDGIRGSCNEPSTARLGDGFQVSGNEPSTARFEDGTITIL